MSKYVSHFKFQFFTAFAGICVHVCARMLPCAQVHLCVQLHMPIYVCVCAGQKWMSVLCHSPLYIRGRVSSRTSCKCGQLTTGGHPWPLCLEWNAGVTIWPFHLCSTYTGVRETNSLPNTRMVSSAHCAVFSALTLEMDSVMTDIVVGNQSYKKHQIHVRVRGCIEDEGNKMWVVTKVSRKQT